jgi:hypothetical protein
MRGIDETKWARMDNLKKVEFLKKHKFSAEYLAEIARKEENLYVRKYIVGAINDKAEIIKFAKTDSDWQIRCVAVHRIDDEAVLFALYKIEEDYRVRDDIAETIKSENILTEIAKTDIDWHVRCAAVRGISDEAILIDVAKSDGNDFVRAEAIKKIKQEKVLINISKTDKSAYARGVTLYNISDENALCEIILKMDNQDSDVIGDQAYSVMRSVELSNLRHGAVNDKINDETILIKLYTESKLYDVRHPAVRKIKDEQFLINIIKTDDDPQNWYSAIKNIDSEATLLDILETATNIDIRKEACGKLGHLYSEDPSEPGCFICTRCGFYDWQRAGPYCNIHGHIPSTVYGEDRNRDPWSMVRCDRCKAILSSD